MTIHPGIEPIHPDVSVLLYGCADAARLADPGHQGASRDKWPIEQPVHGIDQRDSEQPQGEHAYPGQDKDCDKGHVEAPGKIAAWLKCVAPFATYTSLSPLPQDPERQTAHPCGVRSARQYAPKRCVTSDRIHALPFSPAGQTVRRTISVVPCFRRWSGLVLLTRREFWTPHGVRLGRGEEARSSTRGDAPRFGLRWKPARSALEWSRAAILLLSKRGVISPDSGSTDGLALVGRIRPRRLSDGAAIFCSPFHPIAQGGS